MHGKVEIATAAVTEWVGRRVEEAGWRKEYIGFLLTGESKILMSEKWLLKEYFNPKFKLFSFTQPHSIPNPHYIFPPMEHKSRYLAECPNCSFW